MTDCPTPEELATADGYLSRCKPHLNRLQRDRRARMVRIDYMPGRAALAAIEAKRATLRPGSVAATNSAMLDAIVTEWARLTGIKCSEVTPPKSPDREPELCGQYVRARVSSIVERSARAQETGGATGINARIAGVCAGAYESGRAALRVQCGAKRHRDGQPCQAKSEPGKRRCRFHGGRSTGPKTPEGRARALANLRQNRLLAEPQD
ncbi:HGGxSTG domain-containing protein [Thermomonas fusca]|uniref:HGGxSTG domain-containing protein n=1 Tax=Thermomonas fusca TaxID=215690 RepID=UPI0012EBD2E8|nr:HGGxSTG domain-containing protein [Thermomonas fusca]